MEELREPLLAFEGPAAPPAEVLARLVAWRNRYRMAREAGYLLPNLVEAVRIELTYHSNALEGNTLSLRDTQLVIEGLAPEGGKSMRELYEARNHDRALREIEQWVAQRPMPTPLTERDILDVHAIVLADIDPAAGRFRSERVLIAGSHFVPPGSQKFPDLIPRMLELANRQGIDPVVQAAEIHYNLAAVHPFRDGNGRTARLMMNYLLLRQGFPLTIIEVGQRAEYLSALDEANTGQWGRFALFIANSVERSIQRQLGD